MEAEKGFVVNTAKDIYFNNVEFSATKGSPWVFEKSEKIILNNVRTKYPTEGTPVITFDHVTFSYGKGKSALEDVSFSIPDRSVTAIAGVSGSGKSTAASLICRFWDISSGEIRMGGIPLCQIPLSQLMEQISFVTQNNFLFKKSIRENIMMGNLLASE